MSRCCQLSGKKPQVGHNVSHSQRKTKRRYNPNISKKTIVDPVSGEKIKLKIATSTQRTLMKNPSKFKAQMKKLIAGKRK